MQIRISTIERDLFFVASQLVDVYNTDFFVCILCCCVTVSRRMYMYSRRSWMLSIHSVLNLSRFANFPYKIPWMQSQRNRIYSDALAREKYVELVIKTNEFVRIHTILYKFVRIRSDPYEHSLNPNEFAESECIRTVFVRYTCP